MTEWQDVKLSDLISIKHGYAFKGEFFSEEETPYILVTPGNFNIGGVFKSDKFKWYKGEIPSDYILKKDDLIVTMTDLSKNGDTLGYSALVPELNGKVLLHNQRIGLVEIKSQEIDKFFLYWLMRTSVYQKSIVNTASGSTVKHTSPDRICQFSFPLPPLDVQRKIAGILGALDDKIEVLREQNKTLEQMAQAVFQSWFVDFDIVHAKAANIPTEDICKKYHITPDICALFPASFSSDNLPLAWEKKILDCIGEYSKEKTKTADITTYISTDNMLPNYGGIETASSVPENGQATCYKKGNVLISNIRPYFKKIWYADKSGSCSNDVLVFIPKDFGNNMLYLLLARDSFFDFVMTGANGAKMLRGDKKHIMTYPVVVPNKDISVIFETLVTPFFEKIIENSKQIRTLEQTRGTLLPQLLNEKIKIS